jgi:lipoate-protein ligase A
MIAPAVAPGLTVAHGEAGDAIAWGEAQLRVPVERPAGRVTRYTSVAIVLGCGQRPCDADRLRAASAGVGLCVRASGGGTVLAGPWMLGVSVALPPGDLRAALPLTASYAWLGTVITDWLSLLGISAEPAALDVPADDRAAWACFAHSSRWEPCVGGRKIAGLAQVRRRNGVVYTAGVLVADPPWALLCAVLGRPFEDAQVLGLRTTSCSTVLGRSVDAHAASVSLGGVLAEALCTSR